MHEGDEGESKSQESGDESEFPDLDDERWRLQSKYSTMPAA